MARPLKRPLFLHEELLLLCLHDERGTTHPRAGLYPYALAAGVVAELLLGKRITLAAPKHLVNVVSEKPFRHDVLDGALQRIAQARRRAKLRDWVMRIGNQRNFKHQIAAALCDLGILEETEGRVLFIFKRRLYPERDPAPEQALIERLRAAIFGSARELDARETMLIALAHGTRLLQIPFDRRALRERQARLRAITEGDVLGRAAHQAIDAVHAAIRAATTAAAVAAMTAGS